jgi:hypothetical protein
MGDTFEYKIITAEDVIRGAQKIWDYSQWNAEWSTKNVELLMNKLSKEKWELVSVSSSSQSSFGVLIFKRVKIEL